MKERSPHIKENIPNSEVKVEWKNNKIIVTSPQNKYNQTIINSTGIMGVYKIRESDFFRACRTVNGVLHEKKCPNINDAVEFLKEIDNLPIIKEYDMTYAAHWINKSISVSEHGEYAASEPRQKKIKLSSASDEEEDDGSEEEEEIKDPKNKTGYIPLFENPRNAASEFERLYKLLRGE